MRIRFDQPGGERIEGERYHRHGCQTISLYASDRQWFDGQLVAANRADGLGVAQP